MIILDALFLVEDKDIEDLPFLNRFENLIISFDNLINRYISDFVNEIFNKIKDLTSIGSNQRKL